MVRNLMVLLLLCGCSLLLPDIVGNDYVFKHNLPAIKTKDPLFIEAKMEPFFKNSRLWIKYRLVTGTRVDSAQMRLYIEDEGDYSKPVQLFGNKDALKYNFKSIPDSLSRIVTGEFKPPNRYDYVMVLYLWRGGNVWTNADKPFKFKTSEVR